MTLDREALRPAFEAAYRANSPDECRGQPWIFDRFDEKSQSPGEYIDLHPRYAFEGFCAATERLLSDDAVERGGEALGRNALSSCDDHTRRNNARACIIAAASIGKEG